MTEGMQKDDGKTRGEKVSAALAQLANSLKGIEDLGDDQEKVTEVIGKLRGLSQSAYNADTQQQKALGIREKTRKDAVREIMKSVLRELDKLEGVEATKDCLEVFNEATGQQQDELHVRPKIPESPNEDAQKKLIKKLSNKLHDKLGDMGVIKKSGFADRILGRRNFQQIPNDEKLREAKGPEAENVETIVKAFRDIDSYSQSKTKGANYSEEESGRLIKQLQEACETLGVNTKTSRNR